MLSTFVKSSALVYIHRSILPAGPGGRGPSVIGPLHKQRDILAGLPDLGYTDADTGRLTVTR